MNFVIIDRQFMLRTYEEASSSNHYSMISLQKSFRFYKLLMRVGLFNMAVFRLQIKLVMCDSCNIHINVPCSEETKSRVREADGKLPTLNITRALNLISFHKF